MKFLIYAYLLSSFAQAGANSVCDFATPAQVVHQSHQKLRALLTRKQLSLGELAARAQVEISLLQRVADLGWPMNAELAEKVAPVLEVQAIDLMSSEPKKTLRLSSFEDRLKLFMIRANLRPIDVANQLAITRGRFHEKRKRLNAFNPEQLAAILRIEPQMLSAEWVELTEWEAELIGHAMRF